MSTEPELRRRVLRDIKYLARTVETILPGTKPGKEAQLYEKLLKEVNGWWKQLMEGEDEDCVVYNESLGQYDPLIGE